MDLATLVGIVLSIVLVGTAILLGGSPIMFVDPSSALIVIGGTIGVTLMRNPLSAVLGTFGVVGKAFTTRVPASDQLIPRIQELSRKARKDSLLSLENVEVEFGFLKKGIMLCVDGIEPNVVRSILETDVRNTASRHKRGQEILEGMGGAAPAFGMIGTLIGLVQMLANMNDPASIGPAMALALLTTLYGALIANVFCLPLADKLKVRSQEEVLAMMLCIEGVMGIVQGEHPAAIGHQLKAFLAPKHREAPEQDKAA